MTHQRDFIEIITQHKGSIYTVCYMFSATQDEANDLYQEVVANLWSGFQTFRGESKISTWIYRVSLNTCLQIKRKKSRQPQLVPISSELNLFDNSDEDSKQIAQLYKRINRLGRFDKAIFCCGSII